MIELLEGRGEEGEAERKGRKKKEEGKQEEKGSREEQEKRSGRGQKVINNVINMILFFFKKRIEFKKFC